MTEHIHEWDFRKYGHNWASYECYCGATKIETVEILEGNDDE